MSARVNRSVAVAAILVVTVAAVAVLCGAPAHMLMAVGDAGNGLGPLGGNTVSVGVLDSPDVGSVGVELLAVVSAGFVLAVMGLLTVQSSLPRSVQDFATIDPLHGRLLL
jgi:hypothetical protein